MSRWKLILVNFTLWTDHLISLIKIRSTNLYIQRHSYTSTATFVTTHAVGGKMLILEKRSTDLDDRFPFCLRMALCVACVVSAITCSLASDV